jgi:hypothetical protein
VLMYRKLSLSIIDNFAIFGVIELSVFVAKISITRNNLLFEYLNKITVFQPKVIFFLKNSIFKRITSKVWSPEILVKLFKAMKAVLPMFFN